MRVFFALWPDDAVREQLAAVSAMLPERRVRRIPRENLHLTLAFLGSVPEIALADLYQHMDTVRGEPFSLVFDQVGWFKRAGVIWLAPNDVPAALTQLTESLRRSACDCGIAVDEKPFLPHLTLARKAKKRPAHLDFEPIRWDINEFCLIQSDTRPEGAVYRELARRALSST